MVKAKAFRSKITVEFEINPKWDMPMSEKVTHLLGRGTISVGALCSK